MIRLSKLADYAIVLATELAREAEPRAVSELSSVTGIPEPTASKVLKRLSRGGLVISKRGVNGGYSLARSASDVDMTQLIAAIEGPIAITECASDEVETDCAYEGDCDVQGHWRLINTAIEEALSAITLADMARREERLVTLKLSSGEAKRSTDKRAGTQE